MRSLLILYSLVFVTINCHAIKSDSISTKNDIRLSINYPLPASGITFSRFYDGILNVDLNGSRFIYKNFFGGIGCDYSIFKTSNKELDIKTVLTIKGVSIIAGYAMPVGKKISIYLQLNGGYSVLSFDGTNVNGSPKLQFNQSGMFTQASTTVFYPLSKKISLGITGSYKIIFQHFGNNVVDEDANIRMANLGINFRYKF